MISGRTWAEQLAAFALHRLTLWQMLRSKMKSQAPTYAPQTRTQPPSQLARALVLSPSKSRPSGPSVGSCHDDASFAKCCSICSSIARSSASSALEPAVIVCAWRAQPDRPASWWKLKREGDKLAQARSDLYHTIPYKRLQTFLRITRRFVLAKSGSWPLLCPDLGLLMGSAAHDAHAAQTRS